MTTKKYQLRLPFFISFISVCMVMFATKSHALESSVQLHKTDQDKSVGYSISIGDEFFKQKAFNWQINYTRLENVEIDDLDKISEEWDNAGYDFALQTIDLMLGYRYYPKSYNKFINSFMLEFQLGASVNLTEHKLVWSDLDRDDVYFAKQADINPVLSMLLQKNFTKNSAMHIGVKHYPSYSDFGSISTVFIGFNYRFGRQIGY